MPDLSIANLRNKHWAPISLLSVTILAVLLSGLVMNASSGDDIRVAVVMPITGREAKPGQYQREGIELAIRQINDKGGIFVKDKGKKLPIKEIFYDDGSDQAKSAGLVERAMTTDDVVAVIGGYSTALGEAESVMPDRYQTPWITPGAGASHNSGTLRRICTSTRRVVIPGIVWSRLIRPVSEGSSAPSIWPVPSTTMP